MNSIGKYRQPAGKDLEVLSDYYAYRYNKETTNYSIRPLGPQILMYFLGSYMWINIRPEWLVPEKKMIQLNDTVQWDTQSRGYYKTHTGEVVSILTKDSMNPVEVADTKFPNHKRLFGASSIPRGGICYLVEIKPRTGHAAPKLYKPNPDKLKKVTIGRRNIGKY